jgi:hypothetical protein
MKLNTWVTCGYGCHHLETETHRATITRYNGRFVELTIWRKGEVPYVREWFFRQAYTHEHVNGPKAHWDCVDPVESARQWANEELRLTRREHTHDSTGV